MINFEEFKKIELKIATILKAEKVEESENLIKLEVDLGEEKRQILAGIQKYYETEKLVGRQIVIVVNLEPKEMMGLESQGMLLAANVDGKPVLLQPENEVPPGSKIT
ncbi:MAG: methionine--tRNA ligase subunit beta [Patescibacteria group bacterium]